MKRASLVAAGLSLALHAAALFALGRGRAAGAPALAPPSAPVQVEVMRLAGIVPSGRGAAGGASRTSVPARPALMAKSLAARIAVAPGGELPVAPVGEEAPANEAPTPVSTSAPEGASPAAVALPGPAGATALDTTELSLRLQQGAAHCYPAAARRFRQTGEASVHFCLDGAGAVRALTVATSSGSPLLDEAATGCVVPAAAPFGPVTFGRCFTLPVRFR